MQEIFGSHICTTNSHQLVSDRFDSGHFGLPSFRNLLTWAAHGYIYYACRSTSLGCDMLGTETRAQTRDT
jgi:hypothetical protein